MYEHFWLTVHAVKFPLTKCAASSHVFAPANIYGRGGGGVLELRMLNMQSSVSQFVCLSSWSVRLIQHYSNSAM